MTNSTRAVLTSLLAAAFAVAATLGAAPLTLLTLAVVGLFAYGWPVLLDLPWRAGASTVLALTGAGAVEAVRLAPQAGLRDLPLVVAIGLILAFVREVLRRDGRIRLVESLSAMVAGVVIVVAGAGWLAAAQDAGGESLVVTSATCLAVAAAVSAALPWRGWLNVGLTTGAALLAGAGVAAALPALGALQGAWGGMVAGVLVASLHVLLDHLPEARRRDGALGAVTLPILVGGMLIYIVGTIVVVQS
jgi:hypothetical protein